MVVVEVYYVVLLLVRCAVVLCRLPVAFVSGTVRPLLSQVLANVDAGMSLSSASVEYGTSCSNPSSMQSAVHAALTAPSYVDGVRGVILAGGDSCSRAVFAGAMLAARFGDGTIPEVRAGRAFLVSEHVPRRGRCASDCRFSL